ncbi:MAG: VOC family protein [Phycisphaeraceae bacterium]
MTHEPNNPILGGGGLHHVAVRTHDMAASVKFYTEVLQMKVVTAWSPDERSFVHLDTGDGSILELMQDDKPIEPAQERSVHWHLCFGTTRIEEAMKAIEAAGMEITVPVKSATLHNTATNPPSEVSIKVAFFIGPSGEIVELFQTESA